MKWKSTDIAGGAAVNAVWTLFSRVLGLLREILIAVAFGTRSSADIFFAAFAIPNLFRQLLGEGAFSAAFVPTLSRIRTKFGEKEAVEFTSSAVWMLSAALLFVTGMGMIFTHALVSAVVGGFASTPGKLETAVELTRIMFPYLFFVGLAALSMAALNTKGKFVASAIAPAAFNMVSIIALLIIQNGRFADNNSSLRFLAWSALLGGFLQLAVHLPSLLKLGYRLMKPSYHKGMNNVLALMGPAIFGIAITQINIIVDKRFASFLPDGSISYLNYANRIMQFPLGTFGIAVATASIPAIAACISAGDMESFRKHYSLGLRLAGFVLLPCTVCLIVAPAPVTALLFQRGSFGPESTAGAAGALLFYSIGLMAYSTVKITGPAFYSLGKPSIPIKVGAIAMMANILFNSILVGPLAHRGLALATAMSAFLNSFMLLYMLRKHTGGINGKSILSGMTAFLTLSVLAGIICVFLMPYLHVIICILISGIFYTGSAFALKLEEPHILLDVIRKKRR